MEIEMLSLIGGGVAGFIMRYMGAMAEYQNAALERQVKWQTTVDQSQELAAGRDPGSWVRRLIVISILAGMLVIPFILGLTGHGIVVEGDPQVWWNPLTWANDGFVEIHSFLMMEEFRTALLAIIGFYFGGAAAPRR